MIPDDQKELEKETVLNNSAIDPALGYDPDAAYRPEFVGVEYATQAVVTLCGEMRTHLGVAPCAVTATIGENDIHVLTARVLDGTLFNGDADHILVPATIPAIESYLAALKYNEGRHPNDNFLPEQYGLSLDDYQRERLWEIVENEGLDELSDRYIAPPEETEDTPPSW